MLRFAYVILRNLPRIYMIPRMSYKAKSSRVTEEERYAYARLTVRRMNRSGHIKTIGYGMENLPKEGGYVMFPNHQGKYDALGIIETHEKPCSVVIDDAKSHVILTTQFVSMLHGKRMVKTDLRQSVRVISEVAEEVAAGRRYIIFPEGGYYHNHNELREFKPGCFKSAMKAKAPIVPVVLIDSYKVFEEWSLKPVTTQVHYLKPILYEEYKGMTTRDISDMVHEQISSHIAKVTQQQSKE